MSPRRALFYTDSEGFGGAELAMLMLAAGLQPSRWTASLAYHPTAGNEPMVAAARRLGLPLLPGPPLPPGPRSLPAVMAFAATLRHLSPDVFHAHLPWQMGGKFGLVAAVAARVPCIVATIQLFVDVAPDRSTRWQQQLLSRHVDRYLAVSDHVSRSAREQLGWPPERVRVIRNAVDVDAFGGDADPELRARLLGGHPGPLVLVPARLTEQKGHPHLLRAIAGLDGTARFVLAGDGPQRDALELQARELGIHEQVCFLGDRRDMPQLLAACDLAVLPSLYEGLPLVVLEAMAAGRPVIATAIGGTDEAVLDGVTGLLVPPADPAALRDAIARVVSDPGWGRAAGAAGRRHVEQRFSAAAMVEAVTEQYASVLSARAARPARRAVVRGRGRT